MVLCDQVRFMLWETMFHWSAWVTIQSLQTKWLHMLIPLNGHPRSNHHWVSKRHGKKNILSQIDPEGMFITAPKHSCQLLDKHGNEPNKLAYPAGWWNCQDHVNIASCSNLFSLNIVNLQCRPCMLLNWPSQLIHFTYIIALFPGPTQLFVTVRIEKRGELGIFPHVSIK